MSLRAKAVLVSLLPLVVIVLIAIPEAYLQWQAIRASMIAQHSGAIASASGAILDGRVRVLIAARNLADGRTHDMREYEAADGRFEASAVQLAVVAGADPDVQGALANISRDVTAMDHLLDHMATAGLVGHRSESLSIYAGPEYSATLKHLQEDAYSLSQGARKKQDDEAASIRQLWSNSLLLFALGLFGMLCTTLTAYAQASRLGGAIRDLVAKSEHNRRDEPLGERSGRSDEIGLLDGALHDLVSAQQDRERQLRLYRLLADVSRDAILFVDRETLRIVDANVAALGFYGYERAQLIGLPTARLHAVDDPIDDETIARSDTAEGLSYEGTHQRLDGTTFPVEVFARTAELQGRSLIVKTIRDISERHHAAEQLSKALAQAVDASRLKSEFVATMSHEIRTPMHGVIGMSELLMATPLDVKQREYAATMRDSATALLAIINDILDFSRLEAGRIELEPIVFDPRAVVTGVIAIVRGTLHGKRLVIRSAASQHVPASVRGDATRLRQVLMNLVGNAAKFTESGSIEVDVAVDRNDGKSVVLEFQVHDTGRGVASSARAHLFDAFVQGDGSTTRRFGGSGLGLSICRQLVELMGGRIWLAEGDGQGSTFCFTARFERSVEAASVEAEPATGLRVLIVDDDDGVCQFLATTVASWGMRAASALDPEKARVALRAAAASGEPFGAVLIDFVLPQTDGIALAGEIGADPSFGDPARVIITAFDATGRREAALAAGSVAYVLKPVDPSELYDILTEIERTRRSTTEPVAARTALGARILLAEDSELVRRVALLQLEELGWTADVVDNGRAAVEATGRRDYDLILMDMRMPELNGLDATRAIRAVERENGRHTVIVALTANAQPADREQCIDAGMDEFLTKPLQLEGLRAVLDRWLPQRV